MIYDDSPGTMDDQNLTHPSELNYVSVTKDEEDLVREYEELYIIDPRTQDTVERMVQILEILKSRNNSTAENIPTRSLSESDLSDDSDSKRVKDTVEKDVTPTQIWTGESPFADAISRIIKIRESEGRPLIFSSMSESQMEREKQVIKKELTRLKEYSKVNDNVRTFRSNAKITDEEKLMLKRLLCWYKELKALTASLNKQPEAMSNNSEM